MPLVRTADLVTSAYRLGGTMPAFNVITLEHAEAIAAGAEPDLLRASADAGVSSVMFDASNQEYRENVSLTKAAADWAHARRLFVDAELGEIGSRRWISI
jgi:fructose-bisphosphate aldolase class II